MKNIRIRGFVSSALLFVLISFAFLLLMPRGAPGLRRGVLFSSVLGGVPLSDVVLQSEDVGAEYSSQLSEQAQSILDELGELLPSGAPTDPAQVEKDFGIEAVLSGILNSLSDTAGGMGGFFLMLFGVSILFAAAQLIAASSGELSATVSAGVGILLSLPIFFSLSDTLRTVSEGMQSASGLFSGLIPIMSAISSLSGRATTAAASAAGMGISLGFVSGFLTEGLLPMVALMFSLSLVGSSGFGGSFASVSRGVKSLFMFCLGAATTVIVASLAIQTAITSSADSVALRSVKYAISGAIPMVGSVVSGALSTLTSGVALVASTAGAASIGAMIAIIGAPLIQLLLYRLAFGICIGFLGFVGADLGERILGAFRSALDALIAVFSCCAVIYILEIVLFMKYGVPV